VGAVGEAAGAGGAGAGVGEAALELELEVGARVLPRRAPLGGGDALAPEEGPSSFLLPPSSLAPEEGPLPAAAAERTGGEADVAALGLDALLGRLRDSTPSTCASQRDSTSLRDSTPSTCAGHHAPIVRAHSVSQGVCVSAPADPNLSPYPHTPLHRTVSDNITVR
jgi:hypothetical protein